jgi:hypothetical protein
VKSRVCHQDIGESFWILAVTEAVTLSGSPQCGQTNERVPVAPSRSKATRVILTDSDTSFWQLGHRLSGISPPEPRQQADGL